MQKKSSVSALEKAASERILIIDGAMGTMIQKHKPTEETYRGARFKDWPQDVKGNNDLLVLTQPDMIKKIHGEYLQAGADIIETNTFNAQVVSLADYGMQELAYEINLQAAKLARAAADEWTRKTPDKPRFVAGAVGPTNRTASISPKVNDPGFRNIDFDELRQAYKEQGKPDLAIADFTKAIELYADYAWAYAERGNVYRERGDFDQAIADFTKAIEIYPEYSWAYRQRSLAYRLSGKYDNAAADYYAQFPGREGFPKFPSLLIQLWKITDFFRF